MLRIVNVIEDWKLKIFNTLYIKNHQLIIYENDLHNHNSMYI